MIDKNGKLFGKISIVDLAVIAAVVILLAGIYVRFLGGPTKTVVQSSDFYYTLEVKNIRESNLRGLEKSLNGRFYLNEKITSEMGVLINIESSPAKRFLELTDGRTVDADLPERFDAILTFKLTGRVNDRGYFTPTLNHISSGISYNIKGKYSAVTGKVLKVWE
jgi:hypothetical protein